METASSSQLTIPQTEPPSASLSTPSLPITRAQRQLKAPEKKDTLSLVTTPSAARSTRANSSQSAPDTAPPTNGTTVEDSSAVQKVTDPNNPTPWKHPDELPYIRREDWSQDLMLEYLIQKSFSIPPRDNASNHFMEVRPKEAPSVTIPRKYRVPLMFLAKFQWESLRLVLNAADPMTEWHEFKFDIIHITRLCQHLFNQAKDAKAMGGPKGLDKMWRSPMFDRVLTRFYHHWFISREWFLKHFYEEFEEEEYQHDILRNDWARWAIKGHKGFRLTKAEIQNGITCEEFMRGLGRNADGIWTWTTEPSMTDGTIIAPALSIEPPSPSASENMDAITNVTPVNNTIEVKREHLESPGSSLTKESMNHANDDEVVHIPTPTPISNPTPPIEEVVAPSEKVAEVTVVPAQVPGVPIQEVADPGEKVVEDTVAPIQMAAAPPAVVPPSEKVAVDTTVPAQLAGASTEGSVIASEKAVEDTTRPDKLARAYSEVVIPTNGMVAPQGAKVVQETAPPAQVAIPPGHNGSPSQQVTKDTSTPAQLAGTKRPRNSVELFNPRSPRKNQYTPRPRRAMGHVYTYIPIAVQKIELPQKSPPKTNTDATVERNAASEKLSIKLKRPATSVTIPLLKKRKGFDGSVIDDSSTSISAPLGRHSPRKRARRPRKSTAVKVISHALITPGPSENADSVSAAMFRLVPPDAGSNNSAGQAYNKSSAALLIPTNPKQNMSYVPRGPDSPNDGVVGSSNSPTVPTVALPTVAAPTADARKDATTSLTAVGIANGIHVPTALPNTLNSPLALVAPMGHASLTRAVKEVNTTALDRPKMFVNASESIIAHGLLEVGRPPSAAATRKDNVNVQMAPTAPVPTPTVPPTEKRLPKGLSPVVPGTPNNGISRKEVAQEKQPEPRVKAALNGDAPRSNTPLTSVPSEMAPTSPPAFPASTTISSLIRKTLPEPQTNASAPSQDRMAVDNEVDHIKSPSTMSRDRSIAAEHSVGLLMAQDTRAKSLHTILLLRDLLEFLRLRSQSPTLAQAAPEQGVHTVLDSRTRRMILDEEESITVDQRLDVLAHASVALAKVLYPYRGMELERRIVSLDKRLQQQFDMVWTPEQQLTAAKQLRARILPEKEVQTSVLSISRGLQTVEEPAAVPEISNPPVPESTAQAVQTSEELTDKELASAVNEIMELPPPPSSAERKASPLSSDVTMVDMSVNPLTESLAVEIPKPTSLSNASQRSAPVAKIMMAIMRNMADLLECSTHDGTLTIPKSEKGKERESEAGDLRLQVSDGYGDSPIVSTIINEFRSMKDELRTTEQWSREEIRTMSLHHRTEVDSLKEEIKRGKEELDLTKRRYQTEIDRLTVSLQSARKDKERVENADDEERAQALELQELKRRISSLESRSRFTGLGGDSISAVSRGSPVPATPTELPSVRWQSQSHVHIPSQDFRSAPSPSPNTFARENSSKPGTPVSGVPPFYTRSNDGAESEESLPLPLKSQRKKNMFMFPRSGIA